MSDSRSSQGLTPFISRRVVLWVLGGGCAPLAGIIGVGIIGLLGVTFFAGIGFWLSSFFGPHPPAFATPMSRPTEWLGTVTSDAERDQGIPNTVVMAVIEQASDGQVFGDRYYCANGQTTGEPCATAFPATKAHLGPRGISIPAVPAVHTLGIGESLMGLNTQDVTIPSSDAHSVSWNLDEGIGQLAQYLRSGFDWETALTAFHATVQAPPGWRDTESYASTIQNLVNTYNDGPVLGAWAVANWASKTGQFTDPGNVPEPVTVVGAAPVGAPFSHTWSSPTIACVPAPPHSAKPATCHTVDHLLSGRDLAAPVSVIGHLKSGQTVAFRLSAADTSVTAWSGGSVWGASVPLTGKRALTTITAQWATGEESSISWPEQPQGAPQTIVVVPPGQALTTWWPDILVASRKTGVPADWIAAEMLNEDGTGNPSAGQNGLASAYGLMQLEPATAQDLPGYYPGARQNPQENLILGAEYLAELHNELNSWRITSAAYYGGPGAVLADGVTPGMPWTQAAPLLDTVPPGNSLTMAEYANNIEASSLAVHAIEHQ